MRVSLATTTAGSWGASELPPDARASQDSLVVLSPHGRRVCSCAATRSVICWARAPSFGDSWLCAAAMMPGTTPASEMAAEKPG